MKTARLVLSLRRPGLRSCQTTLIPLGFTRMSTMVYGKVKVLNTQILYWYPLHSSVLHKVGEYMKVYMDCSLCFSYEEEEVKPPMVFVLTRIKLKLLSLSFTSLIKIPYVISTISTVSERPLGKTKRRNSTTS